MSYLILTTVMDTTRLSSKGQLVLPKERRQHLRPSLGPVPETRPPPDRDRPRLDVRASATLAPSGTARPPRGRRPRDIIAHTQTPGAPGADATVPGVNVTAVFKASAAHLIPYRDYSMISSICASNTGEIVNPSACAVFRFITAWSLVGCSTGRSAGLAPLMILST